MKQVLNNFTFLVLKPSGYGWKLGFRLVWHQRPGALMFSFFEKSKDPGLWCQKNFLSPILMKLKIWNPYAKRISNFETWVFDVFKLKLLNFQIDLVGRGAAGHTSRYQDIIRIGLNLTLHMVSKVASRSQFWPHYGPN